MAAFRPIRPSVGQIVLVYEGLDDKNPTAMIVTKPGDLASRGNRCLPDSHNFVLTDALRHVDDPYPRREGELRWDYTPETKELHMLRARLNDLLERVGEPKLDD